MSVWQTVRRARTQHIFSCAEDSTALAGLVIAFAGVFLGHKLELPQLDGIASILIGVLLAWSHCCWDMKQRA